MGQLSDVDQGAGTSKVLLTCGDRPFDLDRRPSVSTDGTTLTLRLHVAASDAIEWLPLAALRALGVAPSGPDAVKAVPGWKEFAGYIDAAWSHDGALLLVDRSTIAQVLNGGDPARLLSNLNNPSSPTVSADGSKIAFIQNSQIYTANRDGTGLARLTSSSLSFASVSFSPVGARLVAANRNADLMGNEVDQMVFVSMDGTTTNQLADAGGAPIYADAVLWLDH